MRKLSVSLVTLLLIGLTLTGCMNNTGTSNPITSSSATASDLPTSASSSTSSAANSRSITVSMTNHSFSPKAITAKAGETLVIELNNGLGIHDFVISELNVRSKVVSSGEKTSVTINIPADAAGKTYEFFCSVGNHRQLGMVGTLSVQ